MIFKLIANELNLALWQIEKTVELLKSGATVPFISRYRKEQTGELDEVQVGNIKYSYARYDATVKRKEFILESIEQQDKLTSELRDKIESCWNATDLEDIYLPYKPKRQTRAEIARKKGLENLAKQIFLQANIDVKANAENFINDDINTVDDAIQGACDIIAEWINESSRVRNSIRNLFKHEASISSKLIKGKEEEGDKYRDYFDSSELLSKSSSHRLLAMRRGESDGVLRVEIKPEEEVALYRIGKIILKADNESADLVGLTIKDAYKRLLKPSIETEFANLSKEKADDEAIRVFSENLRQLLLAAPLGQKRVLAVDPGYRTGCKLVCLDSEGNLLHNETIYPHAPQKEYTKAANKLTAMVSAYNIEAIAIGNGTASRETESFITNLQYDRKLQVFVVSENGASIYSASKVARDEFPSYDVTVRGSISIGRRLMDPLAELVKIEPKSLGVGQYQHDVDQNKLKDSLDIVVESSVNVVGVNVNTASQHLLMYVSGLGPTLAQNIVDYRTKNGAFSSRKDLQKVPRLGAKAYEQSAGFLRILNAKNPLDNSAVHPESYHIVEKMAKDLACSLDDLIVQKDLKRQLQLENYVNEETGLPTLKDILQELDKPGRDPRQQIKVFQFDPTIRKIEDVKEGMKLPGIVTNITNFGCFVDLGIKENGLVHISQLADRFISDPTEIVSLHQHVEVQVLSVDLGRKRVQLTMKSFDPTI